MLAAAPPSLPVDQESRLIGLLRGGAPSEDSAGLLAAATASRLAGPVAHRLGDVRTLALQELEHRRAIFWLRRAGEQLDLAGIPFVALKGAALGERYYRPHFLRACGDIDLLIHPAHFPRAAAAIALAGYTPDASVPNRTTRMLGHDATFSQPGAPPLELHIRLHSLFGIRPHPAPLLERAVPLTLSHGYSVSVLAAEDQFVHLAAHAVAHRWSEARWLYDIVLLLEQETLLDWELVVLRMREIRVTRAVLLTCAVLETEWAVTVPLTSRIPEAYALAQRLLPSVRRAVWSGGALEKTRLLLAETRLCDGPIQKLRLLTRGFTYPVLRRFRDLWSRDD